MTDEQKEILIAKMIDDPSSLSDKELEAIMNDDELRDIHEMSAAVSGVCAHCPDVDVDDEWERFRPRIRKRPQPARWMMRVAAIFLGVLVSSGITVRIIDRFFTSDESPRIAAVEPDRFVSPEHVVTVAPEVEEAVPVRTKAAKRSAAAPGRTEEVDIDEYLRIQQARIDNDIALQNAEIYADEYKDLMTILELAGAEDAELDNAIKKVTIQ